MQGLYTEHHKALPEDMKDLGNRTASRVRDWETHHREGGDSPQSSLHIRCSLCHNPGSPPAETETVALKFIQPFFLKEKKTFGQVHSLISSLSAKLEQCKHRTVSLARDSGVEGRVQQEAITPTAIGFLTRAPNQPMGKEQRLQLMVLGQWVIYM